MLRKVQLSAAASDQAQVQVMQAGKATATLDALQAWLGRRPGAKGRFCRVNEPTDTDAVVRAWQDQVHDALQQRSRHKVGCPAFPGQNAAAAASVSGNRGVQARNALSAAGTCSGAAVHAAAQELPAGVPARVHWIRQATCTAADSWPPVCRHVACSHVPQQTCSQRSQP